MSVTVRLLELANRSYTTRSSRDQTSAGSPLFDHEQGSALATAHLLEHGHRRIGIIAPPREIPTVAPKNTPDTSLHSQKPESHSGRS